MRRTLCLAPVRAGALPAGQLVLDRPRRQAAEPQVGRQPRGSVRSRLVAAGVVVAHRPVEEPGQPGQPCALPARGRLGHFLLEAQARQGGHPAVAGPRGHVDPPGRVQDRTPCEPFPVAVEGREHGVGTALAGPDGAHVVHHTDPRMCVPGHARMVQRGPDPPAPDGFVGAGVTAQVHLAGPGLGGQRGQFPLGRPVPDDQPRAPLRELPVQVGQALQQEYGA